MLQLRGALRLRIARLELVAASAELLRAEIGDRERFARLLEACIPRIWPHDSDYTEVMSSMAQRLEDDPQETGWWSWYFVLRNKATGQRTLIGNGGFKGPPDTDGVVEIGYSLLPPYRSKGYTTEAVERLVEWAFEHPQVTRVIAEAQAGNTPSIRVLEKAGFDQVGPGSQRSYLRFELKRPG